MQDVLLALLYLAFILTVVILSCFVLWFQFRERPAWDTALFIAASVAMALLVGGSYLISSRLLSFPLLPACILYLWFSGLWSTRRERSAIQRWGLRQGLHVTTLERGYDLNGRRLVGEYRIVARRVSDGRILTGRVLTGSRFGSGFDVQWQGEVPPQHLHRKG